MKPILLLLLSNVLTIYTYGQHLYINTDEGEIYKIENDTTLTFITTVNNYVFPITDIAISPSFEMYGIASNEIIKIDLANGNFEIIGHLPFGDWSVTLVCDNNYHLFILSSAQILYSYNLQTGKFQLINYLADSSPGDITFYRGNIIFQSTVNSSILAYNIESEELLKVICRPSPYAAFWGIANLFDSCGVERLYATDPQDNLYELDIENNTIHLLKKLEMFNMGDATINGMASSSENQASVCKYTLEEVMCSSTQTNETYISSSIKLYPNPADDIVFIESDIMILQVSIFNSSGSKIKNVTTGLNTIDISDLPGGLYIFQVQNERGVENIKMIIR